MMQSFSQLRGLLFFVLLLLFSCQQETPRCDLSFYHWKKELSISSKEQTYLDSLHIQKLYLRFFDVDYDFNKKETKPIAVLNTTHTLPNNLEIVPTVFITNRTLLQLEESELPQLSDDVFNKIKKISQDFSNLAIQEIQIDCDWSQKTKWRYFRFLTLLKDQIKVNDWKLSVTIRLHQIKFFQRTGIPPADRGMLMFYNMGDLENWESKNSILDLDIAQQYMVNFDQYPLSLDLALPIFSWGVLFRDGKMIRLINNLESAVLVDTERFLKVDENRYEVIKSTYLQGHYLYQKDLIRLEPIQPNQLKKTATLLQQHLKKENRHVVFYHLDTATIKHYPYESLYEIGSILSK